MNASVSMYTPNWSTPFHS